MKIIRSIFAVTVLLMSVVGFSTGISAGGHAQQLDRNLSKITYLSTKVFKGDPRSAVESNTFKTLSGNITDNGTFMVAIDLASVETGIGIRNERMLEHFFEVSDYPQAKITGRLSEAAMKSGRHKVSFNLSLHGKSKDYTTQVLVARQGKGLIVTSINPVVVEAADFNLVPGLVKLTELAGLSFIPTQAPVSFSLHFTE